MHVLVDTREPSSKYEFLSAAFPNHSFEQVALNEGDFATQHVIVERKTISDLYGSIIGSKGKKGRFEDQVLRLACHDKIVLLLITGNIFEFIESSKKRGRVIDTSIIYGAIGSVSCRERIHVMWIEHEYNALLSMIAFMNKVNDGNYSMSSRRDPDILLARYFKLTPTQWKNVRKKFNSLLQLSSASEKELMEIKGIGKVKAHGIKELVNGCW